MNRKRINRVAVLRNICCNLQTTEFRKSVSDQKTLVPVIQQLLQSGHCQYLENLKALNTRILTARAAQEKCDAGLLTCDKQADGLAARKKMLSEKRDNFLREKEILLPELAALKTEQTKLKSVLSEGAQKNEKDSADIERYYHLMTENTGMRVFGVKSSDPSSTDSCVEILFTNIDPREPGRKFCIIIKIREDKTVRVTNCEPMITSASALKRAAKNLNESYPMDWHSFFVWLRAEFCKLV